MALICPYCFRENVDHVLVCGACARDVAVPDALLMERRDLIAKRDAAIAELSELTNEIASIRSSRRGRS